MDGYLCLPLENGFSLLRLATVEVSINGVDWFAATLTETGAWGKNFSDLSNSSYTYYVKVIDSDGLKIAIESGNFEINYLPLICFKADLEDHYKAGRAALHRFFGGDWYKATGSEKALGVMSQGGQQY